MVALPAMRRSLERGRYDEAEERVIGAMETLGTEGGALSRMPLQVRIELDQLRCHTEGERSGRPEPYLWSVFFKVDGETVVLGDDLFLHGTGTVVAASGSHGNLGDTDVAAGDAVHIPAAIGEFQTTLKPIAVPDWVRDRGVREVGGVAGVAVVLMEEDWASDSGAEAGRAALDQFIRQAISAVIPTLGITKPDIDDEDIAELVDRTESAVAAAVEGAHAEWERFVTWLNGDGQIGKAVWAFSHDRLAQEAPIGFSERWNRDGDWEIFGASDAVPASLADLVIEILTMLEVLSDDEALLVSVGARDFRRQAFAGQREFGAWWHLAERNGPAIAGVLRRNPELTRRSAKTLFLELTAAVVSDRPLPEELLNQITRLLTTFVAAGPRRLRVDAKAALAVMPLLRGLTPSQAANVLRDQRPTRKIRDVQQPSRLR